MLQKKKILLLAKKKKNKQIDQFLKGLIKSFKSGGGARRNRMFDVRKSEEVSDDEIEAFIKNVSSGIVGVSQASLNAFLRTVANKLAFAMMEGGVKNVFRLAKEDPLSFQRLWFTRVPYGILAMQSSVQVAKYISDGKDPVDMNFFEKARAVSSGALTETIIGSWIELFSMYNELSAIKASRYLKLNPDILLNLKVEAFDKVFVPFSREDAKKFFETNKTSLKSMGIFSFRDLIRDEKNSEVYNKNIVGLFESGLKEANLTKPENRRFFEFSLPKDSGFSLNFKDLRKMVIASSFPALLRNSSFLTPLYFAPNAKDGAGILKLLGISAVLGVVTFPPHAVAMSATSNVAKGDGPYEALKNSVSSTLRDIRHDPKKVAFAALIRAVSNMIGSLIFNRTFADFAENKIEENLSRTIKPTPSEKKALKTIESSLKQSVKDMGILDENDEYLSREMKEEVDNNWQEVIAESMNVKKEEIQSQIDDYKKYYSNLGDLKESCKQVDEFLKSVFGENINEQRSDKERQEVKESQKARNAILNSPEAQKLERLAQRYEAQHKQSRV